jgi:pimeloyl-ACP methyl ester carboxylesterase
VRATHRDPHHSKRKVPGQGALVHQPGGPDAGGLYAPLAGLMPQWKRIAAAYDLVGYAPRGVAPTAPLSCQDPERFFKAPRPAPAQPSGAFKRERVAEAEAYARGCRERAGEALRHYHSLNNARDLDVVRAALGERRLTFMGTSDGTYLGALYAELFPSHVRRMVFDSPVDPAPEQVGYRNALDRSEAFEGRWRDVKEWIAEHDDVYGLGGTPGQVQRGYDRASARLARRHGGPGPVAHGVPDGRVRRRPLAVPRRGAVGLSAGRPAAADRPGGDAPRAGGGRGGERRRGPHGRRVQRRGLAGRVPRVGPGQHAARAPGAVRDVGQAPRQRPPDVRTGPGELPPTLVLAAERDAAAPYDGALELHRRLSGSVLVTERDTGTHGVGGGPNTCVNGRLEAYLLAGRLPARDASCAGRPGPRPRPEPGT